MALMALTLLCSLHSKAGCSPKGNGCLCLLPLPHDRQCLPQLQLYKGQKCKMQTEHYYNTRQLLKYAAIAFVCLTYFDDLLLQFYEFQSNCLGLAQTNH